MRALVRIVIFAAVFIPYSFLSINETRNFVWYDLLVGFILALALFKFFPDKPKVEINNDILDQG